jgi:hypothetical protein
LDVAKGTKPVVDLDHLILAQVSRQLDHRGLEAPQGDLSGTVADDEVIDRHISKEPAEAPLLSSDELRDAVRVALRDKDDAGSANRSVHDILGARSGSDDSGHCPPPPKCVEHCHRRSGLALHLGEGRPLGPPAKHDGGEQEANEEAEDAKQDWVADDESDDEEERENGEQNAEDDQADPRIGLLRHPVDGTDLRNAS